FDDEHRMQVRAESLVDEHLDGDAAVGQQRADHARRDRRLVGARAAVPRGLDVELAFPELEEVAAARVADVEQNGWGEWGRVDEEGVRRLFLAAWPRRRHLDPRRGGLV